MKNIHLNVLLCSSRFSRQKHEMGPSCDDHKGKYHTQVTHTQGKVSQFNTLGRG